MRMKNFRERLFIVGLIVGIIIPPLYIKTAWSVFQWRNPKANQMTFYRELPAVLAFRKLDKYQ